MRSKAVKSKYKGRGGAKGGDSDDDEPSAVMGGPTSARVSLITATVEEQS